MSRPDGRKVDCLIWNSYNVRRDPGEKRGEFYPGLYAVTPLQNQLKSHMLMIRKFPHRTSKTIPRGAEVTPHD